MSALAEPAPSNAGGLSTAATVCDTPATVTENEIGWSVLAKSTNEADTDEQSALTMSPSWATAVPAQTKNEAKMIVIKVTTAWRRSMQNSKRLE